MKDRRIIGLCTRPDSNFQLIKEAGVEWLRVGFGFPFKDRVGGELTEKFKANLAHAKKLSQMGFGIMGITPLAGVLAWDKSDNRTAWRSHLPEWAGRFDEDGYYEVYEEACAQMARQTAGIVGLWQVSNEMDIDVFRGPLKPEHAARFLLAGGRGVKRGNPQAKAGINPASRAPDKGGWLFRTLYKEPDHPFDFAGIDGYYGSWDPGAPEDWLPCIEEIGEITGKPVLIHEWGYSSLGKQAEPPAKVAEGSLSVCEAQGWHYVWKKEHSEKEQADYTRMGLKIFATYPNVLGSFLYTWADDAVCYHCGRPNCPAECGWGIVDSAGKPKAAYYAFRDTVKSYY